MVTFIRPKHFSISNCIRYWRRISPLIFSQFCLKLFKITNIFMVNKSNQSTTFQICNSKLKKNIIRTIILGFFTKKNFWSLSRCLTVQMSHCPDVSLSSCHVTQMSYPRGTAVQYRDDRNSFLFGITIRFSQNAFFLWESAKIETNNLKCSFNFFFRFLWGFFSLLLFTD